MLTSKQRAHLRSIAQGYNAIFFVGKNGIGEELIKQLDDVLDCEYTAREAADEIAAQLKADVVQVIGRKFVLWRRSSDPKKRVIELD